MVLESLKFTRCLRRLCTLLKINQSGLPNYLYNLTPKCNHSYNTQQLDKVECFYCRTNICRNSFFTSVIDEWNKLKPEISNVDWFIKFIKLILNLDNGCPQFNPIYDIFNPMGLKYLVCILNLVISMKTGLSTIFKTIQTLCLPAVLNLNLIHKFEKYQRVILGSSSPDSVAIFENKLRHVSDIFLSQEKSGFLIKIRQI